MEDNPMKSKDNPESEDNSDIQQDQFQEGKKTSKDNKEDDLMTKTLLNHHHHPWRVWWREYLLRLVTMVVPMVVLMEQQAWAQGCAGIVNKHRK